MTTEKAGAASNKRTYRIFAAIDEETDKGWIWIKDPPLPSRTLVRLRARYKDAKKASYNWVTFCEVRYIEQNFINRYNREKRRFRITDPKPAMVMGEWYRNALGGFPTDRQSEKRQDRREIPEIDVQELRTARLWWALRAACHHPDLAVRLGTRLGVVGVWLGLIAIVELVWKALHPLLRGAGLTALPPWVLELLTHWDRDQRVGPVALMAAVILGVIAWLACRGPKRPLDLATP